MVATQGEVSSSNKEAESSQVVDGTVMDKRVTKEEQDDEGGGRTTEKKKKNKSYAALAKENGMRYTISDVPPLSVAILLGLQHFLTMLGATVLIPLLVTPAMGATQKQTAEVISTIFFVAGLATLVQTTLGSRLPIIQGGSFSFLPATFSIIANEDLQSLPADERFEATMQVLSGAILIVGILQMVIGYAGVLVPMLRYISPVTIAPVIAAIGLSLYPPGFDNVSTCFPVGLVQMALAIIFSQFLRNYQIGGYPVFALFPIILAIIFTWSYAAIFTAADVWDNEQCRTDHARDLLEETPWIRFPYPGQWGAPQFKAYAIVPMIGSMLASMIESIGDYYSCARLSGAPPPTAGIISRGLASEGISVLLAGLWGAGAGMTSYSENIGAMSLTRNGSRAVVQCSAISMMLVGIVSKFSGVLASMPTAMVGGIYCTIFGLIIAVGLSNLQFINLNSERNLFIIGFAIYNSLSVAGPGGYFAKQDENPFGSSDGATIALSLFSSEMIIALLSAFTLDNLVPGTRQERGLTVWDRVRHADVNNDPEYIRAYSLPLFLAKLLHNCNYLEFWSLGRFPTPPTRGFVPGRGDLGDLCCPCWMGPMPDDYYDEEVVVVDEEEMMDPTDHPKMMADDPTDHGPKTMADDATDHEPKTRLEL